MAYLSPAQWNTLIDRQGRGHINLNTGGVSFILRGETKVAATAPSITLAAVRFTIEPAALQDMHERDEERPDWLPPRRVFARACGRVVRIGEPPDVRGMRKITFRPHHDHTFIIAETGEPIHHARLLTLAPDPDQPPDSTKGYGWM